LLAAIAVTSLLETVPAAEGKPTIPIIVKDTTTFFWQIVLAGARKAGRELNVTVPELGAQSNPISTAKSRSSRMPSLADQPPSSSLNPIQSAGVSRSTRRPKGQSYRD
jgi:ribose transport system substrate-binding protein